MGLDLDALLREAVALGASDLHLTVEAVPTVRVDGELRPLRAERCRVEDLEGCAAGLLTPDRRRALERRGDVDFPYSLPGVGRFRCNLFRQRGSLALSIRVIPPVIRTLEELGIPPVAADLARRPRGLVLVVGPAGSGKSTTLAAMVDLINRERACHIITLEDPVEFLHRHKRSLVNQREIGQDSRGFAAALRAALRQDPDVILVGEMRDLETVSTALAAAETGHLVLASLHTGDAVQTVERIVDLFPPHQHHQARAQLAAVLEGVIAQLLLPRAGGGRVAACEVLTATPAVRHLVREGKAHQLASVIQTGASHGMQSFEAAIRQLLAAGLVTEETVREHLPAGALSP
ncbi:MAG: type IV pilus twitching motility protein PilT [Clostridia bacterium]|nr:type IV pilus twitching motility protein PilT [Clostridia bacterium]